AASVNSVRKLLPMPAKPKLSAIAADGKKLGEPFIEWMTSETKQTIEIEADQPNVTVEAFYANELIGSFPLDNAAGGVSQGKLSFDGFDSDGTYAIELVSTNRVTGDIGVRMLY